LTNKPVSILIPDGESEFALNVLRCLSYIPNFQVNVLSNDPYAIIRFSRYTRKYITHSFQDDDERKLDAIHDAIKTTKADIVLPIDVPTIHLISRTGNFDQLPVVCPPLALHTTIDIVNDKQLFSQFLIKNNIPAPNTFIYDGTNLDYNKIPESQFPILAKPIFGKGGEGIEVIENISKLVDFLKNNTEERYIIQSYIRGFDIDCSVLCQNGKILAYTIQKAFLPPLKPFAPPSGIEFLHNEKVLAVVTQLMKALNWSGVAHVDLRYDEDDKQPKVLEINPRFWGSLLGSLIAGVNFPYLTCQLSLGKDFPLPEYNHNQFVHPKAALKISTQKLFNRQFDSQKITRTGYEMILKDPLPSVFKRIIKIMVH
jgi:glutathione synthase/RimK-type ligase-like ATP-grasp enzyme